MPERYPRERVGIDMKITFCSAAGEVTGSTYLLETRVARVLVELGIFQGRDASDAVRPVPRDRAGMTVSSTPATSSGRQARR